MASTTSNMTFGNNINRFQGRDNYGSVHIGLENTLGRLSGLAGTGKSTIAPTIARSYYDKQRLAASFFFSRGGGDVGHAGRFMTSIAVQLARNVPALRQHVSDAVVERDDIASQSLRDQWHHLVLGPLSKLSDNDCPASLVLVVDALDECDSDGNIRIFVQLLAEAQSLTRPAAGAADKQAGGADPTWVLPDARCRAPGRCAAQHIAVDRRPRPFPPMSVSSEVR
ncbi:hypothetical protein EJ02DRAFT_459112 [Clathrospora elynae]|uniref:Nephrocystin 3-like N-terminal domain-containing protein n=1 Tax=Clathrospora elynae TaxID=706981 RepID=A0A6A5SHR1_9PLEO|nr:hypothetical protein EJ02DRAFT_459112 [Clathrospora elynae]